MGEEMCCETGSTGHLCAGCLLLLGLVVLEYLVVLLLVKQLLQAGGVEELEVLQLEYPQWTVQASAVQMR